ncbi:MAG: uncharacterized protein PWP15_171 [Methanothermococcus sp.]|jgi:hypothetical protein|uniref:DUF354 domain-containing protein n=1 Tax=Methanothermococcus TaxID=155862 RepID=UPI00035D89E8|nr:MULTISPECIES: DUF354 domain-containing protein [Methanothermococcus]MDK2789664.1 uncharacterized protein [Methanothermococcus sp.]MDK2987383.1 uncharacterized protein [Methanothermococcus sp.]
MDVWIDLTNSPHVHYFSQLIERFEKEGIEYLITARKFQNLEELIKLYGYEYTSIGIHGGSLKEKLINSAKRVINLTKILEREKPKVAIAKHSVELPRVAFGLGIPSIFIVDNEHADAQNRLTLPLSTEIISPLGTKKNLLRKQGGRKFLTFDGTCEVANVNSRLGSVFPIDNEIIDKLGLDKNLPTIVMRARPNSSYCNGKKDILPKIIEILNKKIDCNIVAFPRSEKEKEKYVSLNVTVPNTIDAISLLYHADAMIGAGGTMNREAAVLGVPTISCYPENLLGVDRYLIKKGRMIHTRSATKIVNYVLENIGKRNNGIVLEDPTELMFQKVCEYLKQ